MMGSIKKMIDWDCGCALSMCGWRWHRSDPGAKRLADLRLRVCVKLASWRAARRREEPRLLEEREERRVSEEEGM